MIVFFFWFTLTVSIIKWFLLGYVISKHGKEKKIEKYNGYASFISSVFWILLAYTLYLEL